MRRGDESRRTDDRAASSSGTIAVSEDEQIFDETFPQPVEIISQWAYYASKYYQERAAFENFDGDGRKLVIMNPSLLLGPKTSV